MARRPALTIRSMADDPHGYHHDHHHICSPYLSSSNPQRQPSLLLAYAHWILSSAAGNPVLARLSSSGTESVQISYRFVFKVCLPSS